MRQWIRRYRTGLLLCALGAALLLVGTGASLGYQALHAERPVTTTASQTSARSGGLGLDAHVGLDTPLAPIAPVDIHAAPAALDSAALPSTGIAKAIDVRSAGIGVDAAIGLASGIDRHATSAPADTSLETQTARASLAPTTQAVAAVAVAFTLAGALAYFWAPLKRLALAPVLALYAKISRAEVFDNGVRERIFAAIRAHPGVSASDLARIADVSWGTTIYHLDVLEQTHMVTSLRKGRYRRYFENGANLTASKDVVAILQNSVTAGVVDTIRRAPGSTQKELAAATNMTPQALHWHLARLVETGVVRKEREGRVVRHFVAAN